MLKILDIMVRRMDRVWVIALVVLFRFLLDLSYVKIVTETYSLSGYEYSPRGLIGVSVSYFITIILAALLSPNLGKVSRIAVFYLFLFTYVPVSTLFAQNDSFSQVPYFLLTVCFLFLFIGIRVKLPEPPKRLVCQFRKGCALKFSLAATGITLAILIAKYGIQTQLPSLSEVYDVRASYKETVSRFIGYVVGWQGKVLNGFLFMAGILRRSMFLVFGALLFQLYLYSITGFRSLLFSFLFLLWFVIGLRFFRRYMAHYLTGTLCVSLVAVFLSTTYANEWIFLPGIFLVRLYFLPALIFYYYYDFFSSHYIDWFSQNLPFSLLSKSNYTISIPYLIGEYYFGGAEISANANFFADGYANLGIVGFLLVTISILVILRGLDVISARKNQHLVFSLVAMPLFSLTNSSLITSLVTHGFLMAMMIILMLSERDGSCS